LDFVLISSSTATFPKVKSSLGNMCVCKLLWLLFGVYFFDSFVCSFVAFCNLSISALSISCFMHVNQSADELMRHLIILLQRAQCPLMPLGKLQAKWWSLCIIECFSFWVFLQRGYGWWKFYVQHCANYMFVGNMFN